MNLLQRYIFKSVLFSCAAAVGLMGFVLIVGNALKDLLGYLLAGQLTPEAFVKLLVLLVPYAGVYALPMGILTGILLVLGRMSAQQEITAMRAAGLSIGFVARPIFLIAAAGVAIALGVNYYYMPRARSAYKATLSESVRANPLSFIVPKTFIRDFPGVVIYVEEKQGSRLNNFWLWQLDDEKRVQYFARARHGRLDFDEAGNKLVLTLQEVSAETRNVKDPEDFSEPRPIGTFEETTVDLQLEGLFGQRAVRQKLDWLTLEQLLAEQKRLSAGPEAAAPAQVAQRMKISITLHEKASTAFAVLAFAVIAIPLGIKVSRKETSANLGIALALVMGYFFLTVCVGWLDKYPDLRPDLLLWLPPLLFLGLGLELFRRVGRI